MIEYTVTEPTRLDTIVYEYYQTLDVYETVLEANAQFLNKYILNVGDKILLPIIKITKKQEDGALWD